MLSPRLRLVLAVALSISSLTFLAITLNAANTRETASATVTPLKAKILRRRDKLKDKLSASELAELRKQANAQDTPEERKFEDEIPKHVPIKFKLRAEKEKKFKDLNNPGWYRDFELEVTNTSDKPIYFLELWLVYPEIVSEDGAPVGVPLRYGRMKFIEHDTRAVPTDVPIQPGATYIFSIPDQNRRGWEWHKRSENTPDPKKVVLKFVGLSFGDGTGFDTLQAVPFPYPNKHPLGSACGKGAGPLVATSGPVADRSIDWRSNVRLKSIFDITGSNSAGYFYNQSYSFLKDIVPSTDVCCGSGCYNMKPIIESCNCGESRGNSYPACTDPQGMCGTPNRINNWCEDYGVRCPEFTINVCVADAPTPPPFPSPSPTPPTPPSPTPTPVETPTPVPVCDPATKPNNSNCSCVASLIPGQSGQWSCFCWVTGQSGLPVAGVPANYPVYGSTQGGDQHGKQREQLLCLHREHLSRWKPSQ